MSLLDDFKSFFGQLQSCCLSDGEDVVHRATKCAYFEPSENAEGPPGAAVVRVGPREWYTFETWEDYTGHGCQCDCTMSGPFKSLDAAIRLGLGEGSRERLGIKLEE